MHLKNCRGRNSSEALEIMAHESSYAYAWKVDLVQLDFKVITFFL